MNEPVPLNLILASASPRRRHLLAQMGVPFSVAAVDIDESPLEHEKPTDYVVRLAQEKASKVHQQQLPDSCVLGADTSVVVDGQILGKPEDWEDFQRMMRLLSGREHRVLTGVALKSLRLQTVYTDSRVRFKPLSDEDMRAYWATGEPQDKAGGYGIQGQGGVFVESIQGSYSGIVGLPLVETGRLLQSAGFKLWMDSLDDAY